MKPKDRVHNSAEPYPILSQMNPLHIHLYVYIHFYIIHHLQLRHTSSLLPSAFPTKILYTSLISSTRVLHVL
jgi:hypothetical protein